jgi:hypothetical protein
MDFELVGESAPLGLETGAIVIVFFGNSNWEKPLKENKIKNKKA